MLGYILGVILLILSSVGQVSAQAIIAPTKTWGVGTTAPSTCVVGELFFDTDASAGNNLYGCSSTDTWTLQGDGGGAGVGDVTAVGSCAAGACFQTETANTVFAGPASGGAAQATFRALTVDDIPNLSAAKITSGILGIAQGGTGADLSATGAAGHVLKQNSLGGVVTVGQVDHTTLSNIGTNTHAQIDSHISATSVHGATDANTASRIVMRDGSGNFSAGTITAALSGNASTATALASDPADCGANTFAQGINTAGTLTCASVGLGTADTTGTLTAAKGGTGLNTSASTGTARVDSGTWSVGHLKIEGSTVAGLSTATAGLTKRLTDGAAIGALVVGDGTNWHCDEAKTKKIFIVTCPPYNAKGDNATDDLAAIQAAETAANAAGGGDIIFPANLTFLVSDTITFRSNQRWIGGPGATIKLGGASTLCNPNSCSLNLSRTLDGSTLTGMFGPAATGTTNVAVIGLTFDGNKADNPALDVGMCIDAVAGSNYDFIDVRLKNCPRDGFLVGMTSTSGRATNVRIIRPVITDVGLYNTTGGVGIGIIKATNVLIEGASISGSVAGGNAIGCGIDIEPNATATADEVVGVTIIGGYLFDNEGAGFFSYHAASTDAIRGVYVAGVRSYSNGQDGFAMTHSTSNKQPYATFVGNVADSNGASGFRLVFQQAVVMSGNYSRNNGQDALATTRSGFHIDSGGYNVFRDNLAIDDQGGAFRTQQYGFREVSTPGRSVYQGNYTGSNVVADWSLSANAVYCDNVGQTGCTLGSYYLTSTGTITGRAHSALATSLGDGSAGWYLEDATRTFWRFYLDGSGGAVLGSLNDSNETFGIRVNGSTTNVFSVYTTTAADGTGTVTLNGSQVNAKQTITVATSGDANPATANVTVQYVSSFQEVNCQDTDGCNLTLLETGATEGQLLELSNITNNPVRILYLSNQVHTAGDQNLILLGNETGVFRYVNSRWVQVSPVKHVAREIWTPVAGANGTTAGTILDLPASNAPGVNYTSGTVKHGTLDFDKATDETAFWQLRIPTSVNISLGWTIYFEWFGTLTTGSVVWKARSKCVADGEAILDPSFSNAYNYVQTTISGTTLARNTSSVALTTTGCAAGETLFIELGRDADGTGGTDSLDEDARLLRVGLKWYETVQ